MKRDDDYIRQFFRDFADSDESIVIDAFHMQSPPEERKRHDHIMLMTDAGLLVACRPGSYRMTNDGHDFVAAINSNKVWEQTKAAAKAVGDMTLKILFETAVGYLKQEARNRGIPIS